MNKVFCRKRLFFSFLLTGYLILFNTSCGLDTFYELKEPHNVVHQPDCSSIDYTESYFEFFSAPKPDDGVPVKFFGTDVYYKIYKSSSQLKSDVEAIQTIANRDDHKAAALAMIEGSNYKYQPLRASGHTGDNVLISGTGKKVHIRLSDYTLYPAQISIDGGSNIGIPVRLSDNHKTFNFKSSDPDSIPNGDDTNKTGSSSDDDWYVAMFAVAVGNDVSYSPIYSNVLYLGSVRIPLE